MTLKGHKNLIANGAMATGLTCSWLGVFVCFGLVKTNTLATSGMPRREQQGSSTERQFGDYLFRRQ